MRGNAAQASPEKRESLSQQLANKLEGEKKVADKRLESVRREASLLTEEFELSLSSKGWHLQEIPSTDSGENSPQLHPRAAISSHQQQDLATVSSSSSTSVCRSGKAEVE